MRSEIERFANVNYFESVDQRELRNLMSSSKVLVLPTLGEGMCLSGLEAMASGVTILTTEFAGLDDYLISGFSGIVLEDITAHEIAIKLNYVYGKSFNNKLMAKRGHLSVRNLTWENYHENFVKFIEKESKFLS
jgi:glycosyltransferase involved in cell wall biosynthesis